MQISIELYTSLVFFATIGVLKSAEYLSKTLWRKIM